MFQRDRAHAPIDERTFLKRLRSVASMRNRDDPAITFPGLVVSL